MFVYTKDAFVAEVSSVCVSGVGEGSTGGGGH